MSPKPKRFRSDKIIQALVILGLGGLVWRLLEPPFRGFASQKIPYVVALDGKTGNTVWNVSLNNIKVWSVTAHAGKIVIVGEDDIPSSTNRRNSTYHLLNLDSKSGKRNWHFKQEMAKNDTHNTSLLKPEISQDRILIPFRLGSDAEPQVVALDANDGSVKWRVHRPGGSGVFRSGITMWENQSAVLRINNTDVLLQKYDAITGEKVWEVPIEKAPTPRWTNFLWQVEITYRIRSTNREVIVLNAETKSLYIYDWETGKLKSNYSEFYSLDWQDLILNDRIIHHRTESLLRTSDLSAGKGIWATDLKRTGCDMTYGAAVVAQGLLVACSHSLPEAERKKSGHVFSTLLALFDLKTGQHKWSQELQNPLGRFELSVAGSSDMLFTCRGQKPKELIALDQTDGHIVWRNSSIACDAYIAPVVDADHVVVLAQQPRWQTWFSFMPQFK